MPEYESAGHGVPYGPACPEAEFGFGVLPEVSELGH